MPDFELENDIGGLVCGIDEVGRGPLAGPVVTACVYIPPAVREMHFINLIQDSKTLSKPKLLSLHALITEHCVVGMGQCSPAEIDDLNILWATMEAMKRSYVSFQQKLESVNCIHEDPGLRRDDVSFFHALIDGNRVPPNMPCPASWVKKGDAKSVSIAAASIVAKVARDAYMAKLAEEFPHYGWESNAAYPSPQHLKALLDHGITPHHRKSFRPVREVLV